MRLVARPGVGVGEIEEPCGEGTCLIHAADEQTRLAQLGEHQRMHVRAPAGGKALQHRVQELPGLLGIAVGQEFHRALEIGKQHGDLLALAFQGAAGR